MMRYCNQCGAEIEPGSVFCPNCGQRLLNESGPQQRVGLDGAEIRQAAATGLRTQITPRRILFMTVASYGFYLIYWFYVTWKQYRDHTGDEAYPIWHALTLFVPIYNLFRTYAHMRTYRNLMSGEGLGTTISPGWAVAAVMISGAIDGVSFQLIWRGELTQAVAFATAVLDVISITIVAWLLLHVQGNLKSYWHNISQGTVENAKIGVGEVILVIVGILSWIGTLSLLFTG
jgi:hypothetical protein